MGKVIVTSKLDRIGPARIVRFDAYIVLDLVRYASRFERLDRLLHRRQVAYVWIGPYAYLAGVHRLEVQTDFARNAGTKPNVACGHLECVFALDRLVDWCSVRTAGLPMRCYHGQPGANQVGGGCWAAQGGAPMAGTGMPVRQVEEVACIQAGWLG